MLDKIEGYRTVSLNIAGFALLVITGLPTQLQVTDPDILKMIAFTGFVLNLWLRYQTKGEVGAKRKRKRTLATPQEGQETP